MVQGETYYVRVSGYDGNTGDYTLVVSLAADVTKNGAVDFNDVDMLVGSWLTNTTSDVDIAPIDPVGWVYGDEFVDFLDFAALAENWFIDMMPQLVKSKTTIEGL